MDPFSTSVAALGLIANVAQLIQYLREVKSALNTIDDDIDDLIKELEALNKYYSSLRRECDRYRQMSLLDGTQRDSWVHLDCTLKDAERACRKFEDELRRVYGEDPKRQGWLDAFKKQHRHREHMPRLRGWRDVIRNYNGVLLLWLQTIAMAKQDFAEHGASANLGAIMTGIERTEKHLEASERMWHDHDHVFGALAYQVFNNSSVTALSGLKASFHSLEVKSINQYFDIPQALDSCYVGRERESEILATAFFASSGDSQAHQRRFVVYGIGGSGKTQFCCKFAQDHQHRFWGVFWVDARSHDQLKQTLAQNVATVGEVANNHVAALHWLSRHERWLLIYDNADEPSINLADYFPKGGRGCILVTTQNHELRMLGTVGPQYLHFQGMREQEAFTLLLNVTGKAESSAEDITPIAKKIIHTLGYLALAIAVAGKTIRTGVCKFQDYLKHFEKQFMENTRRHARSSTTPGASYEIYRPNKVEATFDISFQAILSKGTRESEDAIQLLKMFAFLHCEDIQFQFLKVCVENARKERRMESTENVGIAQIPRTWRRSALDLWVWLLTTGHRNPVSEILPDVLRQGRAEHSFEEVIEPRIRMAMQQLTQYSLTSWNERTDSWSMHPLVNRWAREPLESSLGERHVWCEAAATMLSNCIIIGHHDVALARYLLPHMDAVLEHQANLEKRTKNHRMQRLSPWPVFESSFSPQRARMLTKFSIVYSVNGLFEKAETLQSIVQSFAVGVLGFQSSKTRRITMALANTLSHMGRSNDSAKLLEDLFDNCIKYCGPDHRDTYVATLRLAESRMLQGRVPEATRLSLEAREGLIEISGAEDEETLNAMDVLAGAIVLSGTPDAVEEAQRLNRETWRIRDRLLGPEHPKTLDSRQSFYTTSFWKSNMTDHLEAAHGLAEICEIRKEMSGRENPWTLLAMLYLARVKVELRDFSVAEALFDEVLPIGERNLGEDHMGVLYCRYHIGRMRVKQKRWTEARDILRYVTEKQKDTLHGWGRFHYDRLGGLVELARAHHELGEFNESDEAVAEAVKGFEYITTKDHPWLVRLISDHALWKAQREELQDQIDTTR